MLMLFTCEHCGKRIRVDAQSQGRRGRCSNCGHVMIIPHVEAHGAAQAHAHAHAAAGEPTHAHAPAADPAHATAHGPAHGHAAEPESEPGFRLSAPEPRPEVFRAPPVLEDPAHPERHLDDEAPSSFELIDDDGPGEAVNAPPEIERGLRELGEFEKDQRPYTLADGPARRSFLGWGGESGPAGWLYVKWRAGVTSVLRLLRWIDDWAYLLSVPFIIVMIFGIAIANRGLVHAGAVGVVLINYGRFWTDLLAVFVRPFKDGPLRGVAFLFPPYGVYYLAKHWDKFESTFRRMITSCIPIVLVILAYAFIPAVNPDAGSAQGLGAKLRSGERELLKEIRGDLKELEELRDKLPTLRRPGEPAPASQPGNAEDEPK
jgi:predicted Zn finger-like uncharacterized protein